MGYTATAYLFYGFNLVDDCDYVDEEAFEGDVVPEWATTEDAAYFWLQYYRENGGKDPEADNQIELRYSGSSEGPQGIFVCFRYAYGDWHGLRKVDMEELMRPVTEEDLKRFKEFCRVLKIKWKEPGWFLTAYFG